MESIRRSTKRIRRRGASMTILLVLVVALGACAGDDNGADSAQAVGGGDEAATVEEFERSTDSGSGGGGDGLVAATGNVRGSAAALPRVEPSVIKTATLSLRVAKDSIPDALSDATAVAGRFGGFVLSSETSQEGDRGNVTLRVPAESFEAALADLEVLGKVRSSSVSGRDVGQEFVDLEARLRNWQAQEAVLLKLMDRAESVADTIRVQGELSQVQMEIEQIRGRLRFLRDQTGLSTITVSFTPLGVAPNAPSRFAQAWERAVDLMQGFIATLIVTMGVVVPMALLLLVGYAIFRTVRPRFGQP